MAKSKYEYVKQFEQDDRLLPNTYIVVRIDGRSFHKFTQLHDFEKPNDRFGLDVMNEAAKHVMNELHDITLAYGQSDEYSFVFRKRTVLYQRRREKIMSAVVSLFTSAFVYHWLNTDNDEGKRRTLKYPPSFDGRCVCYPSLDNLKDYIAWRQADCHINNLYNTAFWALVLKGNMTEIEAEKHLSGTISSEKNELLFSKFEINYNQLPEIYRKGSTLVRTEQVDDKGRKRKIVSISHVDLISSDFIYVHCFD